jgi:hypothetical protein
MFCKILLFWHLRYTGFESQSRQSAFSPSRPNKDPPLPHPQASVSLFRFRGDTLACGRGGGGGPNLWRGERHCGTLGKYVLCGLNTIVENSSLATVPLTWIHPQKRTMFVGESTHRRGRYLWVNPPKEEDDICGWIHPQKRTIFVGESTQRRERHLRENWHTDWALKHFSASQFHQEIWI